MELNVVAATVAAATWQTIVASKKCCKCLKCVAICSCCCCLLLLLQLHMQLQTRHADTQKRRRRRRVRLRLGANCSENILAKTFVLCGRRHLASHTHCTRYKMLFCGKQTSNSNNNNRNNNNNNSNSSGN